MSGLGKGKKLVSIVGIMGSERVFVKITVQTNCSSEEVQLSEIYDDVYVKHLQR